MRGIKKYRVFSGPKELFLSRNRLDWFKFFRISSFVRLLFYSDGYIHLKFFGICACKSFKGLASTFILSDRSNQNYRFYFFSPTIIKITLVHFLCNFCFKMLRVWRKDSDALDSKLGGIFFFAGSSPVACNLPN